MLKILKLLLPCLFFKLLLTFSSTLWAQNAVDQTTPDVLTGFKQISESDLQDGWVHLFDGKTFFGWKAIPLKMKKGDFPDPTIKINQNEMTVKTQTPIRLQTPLFMGDSSNLTIDFRIESAACQVLIQGTPLDDYQSTIIRRGMNGGFSTKQISITIDQSVPNQNLPQTTIDPLIAKHFENLFTIDILGGTFVIESIRYRPNAKKYLNYCEDSSSDWFPPKDNLKIEPISNQSFQLSQQGRLETKNSFDNFCLQLEYQTIVDPNNRAETFCNSGLFFRCIPESSLDGYECQINNVPNAQDRQNFLGNDSGSIFRRAAARRLTNRDNEWTYLTVSADNATLRTWINGIPAVVWTDERESDENPRKGCRTEKGTIQLQGHDPWTKIIFQNIRIAVPSAQ